MEWEALADWLRSAAGEMRQLVSEEAMLASATRDITILCTNAEPAREFNRKILHRQQ